MMSTLSVAFTWRPMPHCRKLDKQLIDCALPLARESAGRSIAARMAMMAITTSNSIKVKALKPKLRDDFWPLMLQGAESWKSGFGSECILKIYDIENACTGQEKTALFS